MEALILEKQPLALGAYSTKILRRDYQRALMRVRRSVDGAQAEVRGDSQGEVSLDSRVKIFSGTSSATTLGEFVANSAYTDVDSLGSSSAATVAVWYDQSDFNSHMTQTVVNNQPSIVSSSGNVYQSDNGPQVLFWPGASRQMDLRELVGDFTVHLGFRVLSEYSGIKLFDSTNDLINISRPNSSITLSQITSSSTSLNGHPKSNKTSIDFSQKSQGFVTVSGTFASTGALKIGENFGGLSDFYIYPNAKKGEERRSVEAIQSRENQSPLAYSNRQDIDPQAFLNKFEGVASAFSLRSLTNSLDTKLATVRREVDNKEALVYPDESGYLSLDSPIKWWETKTTGVSAPADKTSKATILGQFFGDAAYSDVDGLGSPSSGRVVELFDQASQNEVFGRRLLDYHTGAEAAYSFRRLSTSYTGPCIEVSVSVGGSIIETEDIAFDDSGSVIKTLNTFYNQKLIQYGSASSFGFAISKWYDQSGNSRDLSQATLANMPLLRESPLNGELGILGVNGVFNLSVSGLSIPAPFSYSMSFDHFTTSDCDIVQFDSTVSAGISSGNYVSKDGGNTITAGAVSLAKTNSFYGVHDGASSEVGLDGTYTTGTGLTNSVSSIELFPTTGPLVTVYDLILWGENKSVDEFSREDIDLYSKALYRTQDPNATALPSTAQPKIYDASSGLIMDSGRVAMEVSSGNYFTFKGEKIIGSSDVSSFVSFNTLDTRGSVFGIDSSYRGPLFNSTSSLGYTVGFGSPSTFVDGSEVTITDSITAFNEVVDGTKNVYSLVGADASSWGSASSGDITLLNFNPAASSSDTMTGKYHEFVFFNVDTSSDREDIELDINSAFSSYSSASARRSEKLLNSHPGAAAAYSVRQINANYTGPVMRVDNGYTELDIYPVEAGELDTEAIIQHADVNPSSKNATISVWYDQSGNGNHATQSTKSRQPTICNNLSIVYENGKPAIEFDGSDDSFDTSWSAGDTSAFTAFNIASPTNNTTASQLYDLRDGNDDGLRLIMFSDSDLFYSASANDLRTTAYVSGQQLVYSNYGSSTIATGIDGATANTGSAPASTSVTANATLFRDGVGDTFYFNGKAQEAIFYGSDKSTDRTDIEFNINKYFGVTNQVPPKLLLDKHPGASAAYSLRRLKSTYDGPAIKVRRASDDTEADVYFDKTGNISLFSLVENVSETTTGKPQGSATFTLGVSTLGEFVGDLAFRGTTPTSAFVVVWYDQAKGNDATQVAAANQPKIYDGTTGVITQDDNSKPAILSAPLDFLQASAAINVSDRTNYQWSVYSLTGTAYYPPITGLQLSDGHFDSTSRPLTATLRSSVSSGTAANAINHNETYLKHSYADTVNIRSYLNGSATPIINVSDTNTNWASSNLEIFASSAGLGAGIKLSEFILWQRDESSNRTNIESDINNHYSIHQNFGKGGLINEFSGAAAAYSLRSLNAFYDGPLVRVRRDSDHVEVDVYADEKGVFSERSPVRNAVESSTGVTVGSPNDSKAFRFGEFAYGANCFVVEWKDQSLNGNHATQVAAANQPKIYDGTTGVVTENGKPAITRNASNALFFDINATITSTVEFTIFSLYEADFDNRPFQFNNVNYAGSSNGNPRMYQGATIQGSQAYSQPAIHSYLFASTDKCFMNGVERLSGDAGTTAFTQILSLGGQSATFRTAQYLQEVIYYASDESSNRTGIETNINTFYDIY